MIINHNMMAANAQRQYNMTAKRKSGHSEKLSSGYKINRAADDAAGLSISEKMRWQVRGLNRASDNIMDGASLVQVTDGALGDAEDIVQRIRELSVQAANDTNTDLDRDAIQREIDQNIQEFNRIAETTTFNGITPLRAQDRFALDQADITNTTPTPIANDGYLMNNKNIPYVDMSSGQPGTITGFEMDFASTDKDDLVGKSFLVTCSQNCQQTFEFKFVSGMGDNHMANLVPPGNSIEVQIDVTALSGAAIPAKIGEMLESPAIKNGAAMFANNGQNHNYVIGHANRLYIDGSRMVFYPQDGFSTYSTSNYSKTISTGAGDKTINNLRMGSIYLGDVAEYVQITRNPGKWGLKIQSGALKEQAIDIPLTWMEAKAIGFDPLHVDSFEHAGQAIEKADKALEWLNEKRSEYGAVQNRLEHAYETDQNTALNTDSAESRIRDTDMAKEMVAFSKENILSSAGESMMTQANALPEQVLRLLQ